MKNILHRITPSSFKNIDEWLLINHPIIWSSRLHYVIFFGLVALCLNLLLVYLHLPSISYTNVPSGNLLLIYSIIISILLLAVWIYIQDLVSYRLRHGNTSKYHEFYVAGIFFSIVLILTFTVLFPWWLLKTKISNELIDTNILDKGFHLEDYTEYNYEYSDDNYNSLQYTYQKIFEEYQYYDQHGYITNELPQDLKLDKNLLNALIVFNNDYLLEDDIWVEYKLNPEIRKGSSRDFNQQNYVEIFRHYIRHNFNLLTDTLKTDTLNFYYNTVSYTDTIQSKKYGYNLIQLSIPLVDNQDGNIAESEVWMVGHENKNGFVSNTNSYLQKSQVHLSILKAMMDDRHQLKLESESVNENPPTELQTANFDNQYNLYLENTRNLLNATNVKLLSLEEWTVAILTSVFFCYYVIMCTFIYRFFGLRRFFHGILAPILIAPAIYSILVYFETNVFSEFLIILLFWVVITLIFYSIKLLKVKLFKQWVIYTFPVILFCIIIYFYEIGYLQEVTQRVYLILSTYLLFYFIFVPFFTYQLYLMYSLPKLK